MSIYSYDTTGKVGSHYQCVLAACASSTYTDVEYRYDGAGNPISLRTPLNGVTAAYNSAGHLTTVSPTWTTVDSNHPATLLTSAQYAPNGGWSTATFGNGASEIYSYGQRWLTGMQVQVTGANQNIPATGSTGSLTISGSEQESHIPATNATGTITIAGYENGTTKCVTRGNNTTCSEVWDSGTMSISVNGFTAQAGYSYSLNATPAYLASALATALNAAGSPVTATVSGATITMTSVVAGIAGNYSFTVTNTNNTATVPDEFSDTVSGAAMSGGTNGSYSLPYDSGKVTATINGVTATASYGQGSTVSSVAQSLASAINSASGGTLTATAAGANVSVASTLTGAATNGPISVSVAYDTGHFTAPSYTVTASGMSGGTDTHGIVYNYTLNHAPDGQIMQAVDSVNGTWSYAFDEFNRLSLAANTNTSGTVLTQLGWDYDRYGNRWHQNLKAGTGTTAIASFVSSTNRAASGMSYDIAGNVINDGMHNYVYDAENRLATVSDAGISYIYDAEGRRVGKSDGTVYTIDGGGGVLDEVKGGVWKRSEVYLGGKHLATVTTATVVFVHSDWLGTERARTNMLGVVCETETSQPFGDNVQKTGNCDVSSDFFTGKPRDAESNLDDFGARYFSSQWGRWMSADWTAAPSSVPYATLTNPQSLNLYAYVGNDPVDGQDADGHARSIANYIQPTSSLAWISGADTGFLYDPGATIRSPGTYFPPTSSPTPSQDSSTPASSQQQAGIGPIPGYSETGANSWRASNDSVFTAVANEYNGLLYLSPGESLYISPMQLKAQAMIESGGTRAAFESDPLQVNNRGDYTADKAQVTGLKPGQTMTPTMSAVAAVAWIYHKSQIHDVHGNLTGYRSMHDSLRNYNGNTKVYENQGGLQHRDWYANQILSLSQ
jgi:RHS repeat-associated protein